MISHMVIDDDHNDTSDQKMIGIHNYDTLNPFYFLFFLS